jgi:cell wall-associated NlpC family hydrolase
MDAEQRMGDGVLTQLLLGEPAIVDEVAGEWARIVAPQQPAAKLDPRGYPGWLPTRQLTAPTPADGPAYVVDATATALRDAPDGDVALAGVSMATRLIAAGPAHQGWRPVHVPGRAQPLWALERDLTPAPTAAPAPEDVLRVAGRLRDVPYVWGGLSAYGVDCSGLVHLAHRRLGVTVPRDADDQAAALPEVVAGQERPGDLYYFARPGQKIHHVGFVSAAPRGTGEAARQMLHACYTSRAVVDEPVRGVRHETLVGVRRVVS